MSIKINSISKEFKTQKVLKNLSFSIEKGEIVGFLGPNGAGKSTTMKILMGYLKPTRGTVFANGINVLLNPVEAQKKMGYLPEHNPLYLDMYVREYLQFHQRIFKIKKSSIESVIKKVGLTTEADRKIEELSKGYRQRVGLASAILHNPQVLILDEPTTGLDPNQLVEIRALIKELGKDRTVLFSSHIIQEIEAVCNRVILINKGNLVLDTSIEELEKQQTIKVTFNFKVEKYRIEKLPNITYFKNIFENTWILTFNSSEKMQSKIFDFAQKNDLKILDFSEKNKNLQDLFQELTQTI